MASSHMEQDPRFYNRLVQVANNVGLTPEDILVVMALESGINSSIHNNNYGGLVQMSNKTLGGLGYKGNVKDFSKEPAFKQLDYIEKHILRLAKLIGGKFNSAEQYYVGNLLPVSLKLKGVREQDPSTIIVAKNPNTPHLPKVSIEREKIFYNSNKGLDIDGDDAITYGDIEKFLDKKRNESHYKNAIAQLEKVDRTDPQVSKTNYDGLLAEVDQLLNSFASNKIITTNNFTLFIVGSDLESSIEFSRVLSLGLRESLGAKATSHLQNNKVEVTCTINGPTNISKKLVKAFTDHLSECFYEQTKVIGGLKVSAYIKNNKKSYYDFIDYNTASRSYRKFMTKFI